jgi:hypothetical protein
MDIRRPPPAVIARVLARFLVGCLFFSTIVTGCIGQIGAPGEQPGGGSAPGNGTPGPGNSGGKPVVQPGDFSVPSDNILVLPFSVRLEKVASVAGVAVSDPLMNSLRDNRYNLGDYDFANSRQPDKTWTALKVSDWVRAVKPICASPQMHARYASLPENIPAFVEAAYGRAATPDDTAAVTASAMGLMTSTGRYETICLAMLSSLEFVAQ